MEMLMYMKIKLEKTLFNLYNIENIHEDHKDKNFLIWDMLII